MKTKTASVTSRDGTIIGYRQVGRGSGLLILHGFMSSGYNHMQLAERLANEFTVYLPDRRGRGLSGPYRADHTIRTDVEDLNALLTKTGTQDVFGISFGGNICLQAALDLPTIGRVAVYEPPLVVKDPAAVLSRFDAEMAQGNTAAALVTAMKAAKTGPAIFDVLPRWLLELMTGQMVASMDKKGTGEYVSFGALAPTLHYEMRVLVEMAQMLDTFRAVKNEVFLLGARKSAAQYKASLDALEMVLPVAARAELPGVGHAASWNADVGGKPGVVAAEVRAFFRGSATAGQTTVGQEESHNDPSLLSSR